MICEKCSSLTGFNYRGNILCATCIDAMIYKCSNCSARIGFNEQGSGFCSNCYEINKLSKNIVTEPRPPIDCEICGKSSVLKIGFSALCQKCADTINLCSHRDYEIIEDLIDNYLHTIYLCRECGLRFHPD